MARLIVGFVVAALWLPALTFALSEAYWNMFWAGAVGAFTVPLTLLVALPLFLILRRRYWLRFWHYAIFGLSVGVVGAAVFWLTTNGLAALNWLPVFLIAGLVSSVVFWVVGVWRNNYVIRGTTQPTA